MSELSEEYVAFLVELVGACAVQQPTLHLLDGDEQVRWLGADGAAQEVVLGGHHGLLHPAAVRFVPTDPEPVRLLLVDKLRAIHGDVEFPAGSRTFPVGWESVRVLAEAEGLIAAVALAADGVTPLELTIDREWQVLVTPIGAGADPVADLRTALEPIVCRLLDEDPAPAAAAARFNRAHPVGAATRGEVLSAGVAEEVGLPVGGTS